MSSKSRPSAAKGSSKFERRAARNRVVIIVMAVLMGLSLVAIPLGMLLSSGASGA